MALVTGGNNPLGIGAAAARALAAQGTSILLQYFRSPATISTRGEADASETGPAFFAAQQRRAPDEVVQSLRDTGARVEAMEVDLADATSIPALFERAELTLGPVDVLVHSAAVNVQDTFVPVEAGATDRLGRMLAAITARSHDAAAAVNSRASALLVAEFARRHVGRGATWGRIVMVSTDGASSFPGEVSYGASKHALESYSRAAATELRPYGISVNVVAPGPIQTGWAPPDAVSRMGPTLGRPEDVADVIVFLASHQTRWLTGQLLYVGNGARMPL